MQRGMQAFFAVSRKGYRTAAVSNIHLTQSSVTKRITALEGQLGASLFNHDPRGMSLTEAGEIFLRQAERIEQEDQNAIEKFAIISAAGTSQLTVGARPVFHVNWVANLFDDLLTQYPTLKLEMKTDHRQSMGELLRKGELDVYLGILSKEETDDTIHTQHVTQIEHGIVLRKDDPIAKSDVIDPSYLSEYRWISFIIDPITEQTIEIHASKRLNGTFN